MDDPIECWKIVQQIPGGRLSSMVSYQNFLSVQYDVGAVTRPNPLAVSHGGYDGLLAFDSEKIAKRYCAECGGARFSLRVFLAVGWEKLDISKYPMRRWAGRRSGDAFDDDPGLQWPDGSVMFRAIMLTGGPLSMRGYRPR